MAVDPDRLHRAMLHMAYIVERYGDEFAPEFERLADAWDELQREKAAKSRIRARARRLLAAHAVDQTMPRLGGKSTRRGHSTRAPPSHAQHGDTPMLHVVPPQTPALKSAEIRGAFARLLNENAVAGRVVVWCTEPSYTHGGTHMPVFHIIPATLEAYCEYWECASNVHLVLNPQREDFERANDTTRFDLNANIINWLPKGVRERVRRLNPWAFYPYPEA